ncbi:hypothetical protein ACTA71_002586 [Dictyostelium dimigraforme]
MYSPPKEENETYYLLEHNPLEMGCNASMSKLSKIINFGTLIKDQSVLDISCGFLSLIIFRFSTVLVSNCGIILASSIIKLETPMISSIVLNKDVNGQPQKKNNSNYSNIQVTTISLAPQSLTQRLQQEVEQWSFINIS